MVPYPPHPLERIILPLDVSSLDDGRAQISLDRPRNV